MSKLKKNNDMLIFLDIDSIQPHPPNISKSVHALFDGDFPKGMMVQATGRPGYGPEYTAGK
jgi:hypothetical protein